MEWAGDGFQDGGCGYGPGIRLARGSRRAEMGVHGPTACLSRRLLAPGAASGCPVALLVIRSACLLNARRCGRVHCYVSGPFFLASALFVVAYGSGYVGRVLGGWYAVGLGIVVVATVLNVLPERLWGRYR